jgi:hypothetical protein
MSGNNVHRKPSCLIEVQGVHDGGEVGVRLPLPKACSAFFAELAISRNLSTAKATEFG